MQENANLKFVIVGHVDHGKSTLIGRLLYDTNSLPPDKIEEVKKFSEDLGKKTEFAYLLDHLEEERRQGVTIDTTQVFFKTPKREYVIIDAPGHVEFVKNMITGASQAEAALLIVDVKEGVKEQTKRHAYILSMLELKQVIVVINKMDLADYKEEVFNKVKEEIDDFLKSIGIENSYYIPVSAAKGENVVRRSEKISWYKGRTVLESLDCLENKSSLRSKSLIFPVQDVYNIDGKRITVGRIEAGTLSQNDEVKILPDNKITGIKSIEKFLEVVHEAQAEESVGVTTREPVFINRGDIFCRPGEEPRLTNSFKANIFWMAKKSFDINRRITLKCSSQEIPCRVEKICKRLNSSTLEVIEEDASVLNNLEVGEVLIKTKKPIVVTKFSEVQELGRFVLVEGNDTCAGGIIT